MTELVLKDISKSFGEFDVFSDLNLSVKSGEFLVIIGPTGSGKSTLLRIIAGLEESNAGSVSIGGKSVDQLLPSAREVAMVFQNYALYPHLSVRGNIELGLKRTKVPRDEIHERVKKIAQMLSIEEILIRKPGDLSNGQRQRVGLARAIVKRPQIFLFDEPLSNLDADLRSEVRFQLKALHRQLGKTMVYVTHDLSEAMTMADRIVVLANGTTQQIGTPCELYENPSNQFVARFFGNPRMNFFPISSTHDIYQICNISESQAQVGIRPEHLIISEEDNNGWVGTVRYTEYLGEWSHSYIKIRHNYSLLVIHSSELEFRSGQRVSVKPTRAPFLFNREGARIYE